MVRRQKHCSLLVFSFGCAVLPTGPSEPFLQLRFICPLSQHVTLIWTWVLLANTLSSVDLWEGYVGYTQYPSRWSTLRSVRSSERALESPIWYPLITLPWSCSLLRLLCYLLLIQQKGWVSYMLYQFTPHAWCSLRGGRKVSFRPNPPFVPKVFDHMGAVQSVDLITFHPPHFSSPEEERLHSLCPVRALYAYVQRTRTLRKSNQLFVSWVDLYKGSRVNALPTGCWRLSCYVTIMRIWSPK